MIKYWFINYGLQVFNNRILGYWLWVIDFPSSITILLVIGYCQEQIDFFSLVITSIKDNHHLSVISY